MNRNTIAKLLIGAMVFAVAMPLVADEETVGGYTWTYRIVGDEAEVFNYGNAVVSPDPTGVVTIPDMLGDKPVTGIGEYAFCGCSGLTGVVMPNGLTNIGWSAFNDCRALTDVTIPGSVVRIGGEAFVHCFALTNVTISEGVTIIERGAFSLCSSLSCLTIPNSVTDIGGDAFHDCGALTDVIIGNGVTNIGEWAFQDCDTLTNIIIGSGVKRIDYGAFCNCVSLTDVTLPDGVTDIRDSAFQNCFGLKRIEIPDSVTELGNRAFLYCDGVREVVAPQCVCTNAMSSLFSDSYQAITNVVISDGVAIIGDDAFRNCDALTHMMIPGNVKCIGENAFRDCDNLIDVTIMDGVIRIGRASFMDCKILSSVTIPDSVTSMGERAFCGCARALCETSTIAGGSVALVDGWATDPHSGGAFRDDLDLTEVRGIGDRLFGSSALTNVTISGRVKAIGENAFLASRRLERVSVGNGVTSIGACAFGDCSALTDVTISGSVTDIGMIAFYGCSGLTRVVMLGDEPAAPSDIYNRCPAELTTYVTSAWTGPTDVWKGRAVRMVTNETVAVGNATVTVPERWLIDKTTRAATDFAANGWKVWECYVLGLDPERADDDFRITRFWMDGNTPMFEFSHTVDGSGNTFVPRIRKMGSASPSGPWQEVPAAGNPAYRFFKAEVALP